VPALLAPAIAVALLLGAAGAAKVVDPTMTVGALRAMRLPSAPSAVRLGAGVELLIAIAALTVSGPWPYLLAALSLLAFAAFVLAALRRGTMVGSCGCFGREDTPPHRIHVALDLGLAGVAAGATTFDRAPIEMLADDPLEGVIVGLVALLMAALLYATFVDLPRTLREIDRAGLARTERRPS